MANSTEPSTPSPDLLTHQTNSFHQLPPVSTQNPSVWMSANDTLGNITNIAEDHMAELGHDALVSRDSVLLGVSIVAVVVVILLLLMVVLRYLAHQKGTYYTHEEASALKSDPEVQEVQNMLEDPDEEES